MTWYTNYKNKLNNISAMSGATHQTPLDIAHSVIGATVNRADNRTWQSQPGSSSSGNALADNLSGSWGALKHGGKTFLDLMSRGLYANASNLEHQAQYIADNIVKKKENPLQALTDPGRISAGLTGAWKGFSGQEKTTTSSILEKLPAYQNQSTAAKFIESMIGDVTLDPLSYIGPGAVKAVAKGGFSLAGKVGLGTGEIPKFGRAKNALTIADQIQKPAVVTPDSLLKSQLAVSGQTRVQTEQTAGFLKSLERSGRWGGIQPKIPPFAIKGNDIPLDPFGAPVTTMPERTPGNLADLAITNSAGRDLANLATKKYPTGVPSTASIYTDTVARRAAKDTRMQPFYDAQARHSRIKNYQQDTAGLRRNHGKSVGLFGGTLPADAASHAVQTAKEAAIHNVKVPVGDVLAQHLDPLFGANKTIDLFDADGAKIMSTRSGIGTKKNVTLGISKERLSGLVNGTGKKLAAPMKIDLGGGKTFSPTYNIKVNGELVPLSKFIKDTKDNVHLGISPTDLTSKVAASIIPAAPVVPETYKLARLNPVGIANWIADHPHLSPEQSLYIRKAGNAKSAATRIEKVQAQLAAETVTGKVRTVSDIEALVKSGQLDPKDPEFQKIIQSLLKTTGAKKLSGVDNRLKQAMSRLDKAEVKRTVHSNPATLTEWQNAAKNRLRALVDNPVADAVNKQVIPHGSLVDAVLKHGNTTVFDKAKIVLTPVQADAVKNIVQRVTHKEFVDPTDLTKYPHMTRGGTYRTKVGYGQGLGRKRGSFNKWSQVTLSKEIISASSKLVPDTLKGPARSAEMYNITMPMLHASEQMLRQSGLPIILGKDATGLPLSLHDVLSALPRNIVEPYFFNFKSSMDVTQITDITEQLVRLAKNDITPLEFDANTSKLLKDPRKSLGLQTRKSVQFSNYSSMFKNPVSRAVSAQNIADAFRNAAPQIMQSLEKNVAEAGIEIGDHTAKLTNDAVDLFAQVVLKPDMVPGDIIGVFRNPAKLIDTVAVGMDGVSQAAKDLSKIQLEIRMSQVVDGPAVHVAARGAEKYAKALTSSERARVATELFKVSDQEAFGIMKGTQVSQFDLGVRGEFANNIGIIRAFHPHYGNNDLRPLLLAARNYTTSNSMHYAGLLSQSAKKYTTEQAAEAFRYIQEGKDVVDPAMQSIVQDLKTVWGEVLGDSHPTDGFIGRNGITKAELDRAFKHYGVNYKYTLDATDLSGSWKKWDVTDPLDLASKVHAAAQSVMVDKILGASFDLHFGQKVFKPGLVKIINSSGRSRVGNVIDSSLYFPEDIARQMHLVDKTLEEFSKPATNNKFLRLLDGTLHSLKAGLTIYRFGHHTRNQLGDMWLSAQDGLWQPRYYTRALKVMSTRGSQYGDFNALKALQAGGQHNSNLSSAVLTLTHYGKTVTFTPDELYKLAYKHGLLPNYNIIEDLSFDPALAGDFNTRIRSVSPFKGKIRNTAAGVSEWRDHYVRISHFIYAMEKTGLKQGKTLEDAIKIAADTAGARVRKWHPDGSDLSLAERTVMRRSILFYSWIRKAIPLVVESAVTHPGRFMAYPKATYNFGKANGIDLQSIGDQFPTDQLFPSWMTDGTQGPQMGQSGAYWGLKPGVPMSDVMDQYGQNPLNTLQTIASSVNPLVKVPMELAAGSNVGTGTAIKDYSAYIDNQIPFGGFLDSMTGKSASTGFTQDLAVTPSNKDYNPSIPVWLQKILNLNSGAGLTNYSKPSYIKQGEFAARDAARTAGN
jgi:hypothetical protein